MVMIDFIILNFQTNKHAHIIQRRGVGHTSTFRFILIEKVTVVHPASR